MDLALLGRIAQGDMDAFRLFYERHARAVESLLRHHARDRDLAMELLQEVFLCVWEKAAFYREERGQPLPWLMTIARNKLYDRWRQMQGLKKALGEVRAIQVPERDPEEALDWNMSLRTAMLALPRDQKAALEYVYLQQWTQSRYAEEFDIPLGTVKWRIHEALKALRARLREAREECP